MSHAALTRFHSRRWLALAALLVLLAAGCGQRSALPPALPQAPAATSLPLKVVTEQAGLTAITAGDLRAAGVDPAALPLERWQLRLGDQPVPLLPLLQDDSSALAALVFYAAASDNPYSRQQVYWLEAAAQAGLRPAVRAAEHFGPPAEVVTGTLDLAWRQTYHPQLTKSADRWLGQPLLGGREVTLPLAIPDYAGGPATLHLRLWASTHSPAAEPDHHLEIWLNGRLLADEHREGQGVWDIELAAPDGLLRPGANELRLVAPGDTGARVEQAYPDELRLVYAQRLAAQDGRLAFEAAPGAFRLAGLATPTNSRQSNPGWLLWDVSDPQAPAQLILDGLAAGQESEGVVFGDPASGTQARRYVAATVAGLLRPAQVAAPLPGDLRAGPPPDYVAIGPADLLQAAQPLLDWRQQHDGLSVAAADVQAVYEQFDHGRRGPEAIRSYLRYLAQQRPADARPLSVLLLGDASYDPLGYSGNPTADRLPTCLVDTLFIGQTASDSCYAAPAAAPPGGGAALPELAVGRLPAQTPAQVEAIVAKTLAYERQAPASPWLRRALLIADTAPEFAEASRYLANQVLAPAGFVVENLDRSEPALAEPAAARGRLFDLLEAGMGLVNYAGHGSPRWLAGELLSSDDAARLPNNGRWPIISAMTCLSGFFHHPSEQSLSEALLWAEGGAVATVMPSSEGITPEQLPLTAAFYRQVAGGQAHSLGEAVLAAKREVIQAGSSSPDLVLTLNLLGDPALRLPWTGD